MALFHGQADFILHLLLIGIKDVFPLTGQVLAQADRAALYRFRAGMAFP